MPEKIKIRPIIDCVFKAILGRKENVNLLLNFLNAVLERPPGRRVVRAEILNPYNEREFHGGKLNIVDIKARDESGGYFQIEVQVAVNPWLPLRALYTWASNYASQLGKGEDYETLRPVVSIWILGGAMFAPSGENDDPNDYLHLVFDVRERGLGFRLSDHFSINVLQLPFWKSERAVSSDKQRWIYFFKEGENMDVNNLPSGMDTEEMRQAFGVLEHFAKDKDGHLLYLSRLEALREELTREAALKRRDEALKKMADELRGKDDELRSKDDELRSKDDELRSKDDELRSKDDELTRLRDLLKKAGMSEEADPG
jgi:predicted transposase/invertase (TIGR01784 family)